MIRRIIQINQEACNGCGACAAACHEGAIGMVNGKATLLRDDYCDGLGDCLPACPVNAITFVNREAAPYNEKAVPDIIPSCLGQWPVQIKLAPVNAPYFENASLLIAADCTAYAYAGFHQTFMKGKSTLIGCPKLDAADYSEKLTEILGRNSIRQITIVRMEVPCCQGIVRAVKTAMENCSLEIPLEIVTVSIDGRLLS